MMKHSLLKQYLLLSIFTCCYVVATAQLNPYQYSIQKTGTYQHAAASCAHPLASQVGMMIMKKGGNAVDAAIAMQWTLAVVYPAAGNIGGGGFMVCHFNNGINIALDYREMAPGAAYKDMYVDTATGKANTRLSQSGHLAVGVPGTPAGLFAAHQHAKLPMKTLIQPAIDLAEKGFVITEKEARGLNGIQQNLERINTSLPVFYKPQQWKEGDTLVQVQLAQTLNRIRDHGVKGFYTGETADLLVKEMERGAGIIALTDLKNYTAKNRAPVVFDYKGYQIITMSPPSSGGIMIKQMLKALEHRPLPQYGHNTAKTVQLVTEVERRAFADRAEHLGDPDFYPVNEKVLTSPAYIAMRMKDYDSTRPSKSEEVKPGLLHESMETTHLSVMDKDGNAVAVTTTLNGSYGSKVVVSGAGFFLNNEMDDFSVQPGVPNMFGAIGGAANAIAPGKRMLSSMTPTIVLKNNKPFMVLGTPGGTTIITSVLQTILNVIDFNMSAADAVNQPKFHHQWLPDEIKVEKDFPMEVRKQLEAMGYTITEAGAWSATDIILVSKDGKLNAVGDKRGTDSVAGY